MEENNRSSSFLLWDSAECDNLTTLSDTIGCVWEGSPFPFSSPPGTRKPGLSRVGESWSCENLEGWRNSSQTGVLSELGFGSVGAMGTYFPS